MISPCGYCKHHKKDVSYKYTRKHGCFDSKKQIKKDVCPHFLKYDNHPIWEQIKLKKALIKKNRLERKMRMEVSIYS